MTAMREVVPTRGAAMELADERRLMRQGYEFLDEKRMLLATELLQQMHSYEELSALLTAQTKAAADALAAAVERHGLDSLQVYPKAGPPPIPVNDRRLFLGLVLLSPRPVASSLAPDPKAIDPSPEAKACRAAFARIVSTAAGLGVRAGNLSRLAREYRRTERRAKALEKVLLPEVEEASRYVDEQLDAVEREEVIRTARSDRPG
jgi:V/A-type H+/Na+-transporting ATPase subunit D